MLSNKFIAAYKDRPVNWGYGLLGWIVYLRTYSRPLLEGGVESWYQTVRRVVEGCYMAQFNHCQKNGLPWDGDKAQRSAEKMYDLIFNFKFLPPGRGLWAMGTEYVAKRGSAALNNCAFISTQNISKDFAYPFCFLMDMSMLGVGVGSDTRGAGTVVVKKPKIGPSWTVLDSREGWVESVAVILNAFAGVATLPAHFDYSLVREEGAPIRGFGGTSAGRKPLVELHQDLVSLLEDQVGEPVTSRIIVDIFNMIGRAVVAGGIRRTAEIMLGSPFDDEFINLKNRELWPVETKKYRWASNNSLLAYWGMDYSEFTDQIMRDGEPGFFWLDNARLRGRMKEPKGDHDPYVLGQNPCGEISLESGEFCNLVEVYPANHDTEEELQETLKYAYLYAKSVSLIPTHNTATNAIIGRNRRIGVSVTGVTQALAKHGVRRFFSWLDDGYRYLTRLDRLYSRWLCVPESIKLTTVKPSGTVSLLTGSTPGVHYPHAEYYIRNVRFDPSSPLLPVLRKAGYPVEKSIANDNTFVVSFPVHETNFMKGKQDVSVWEQFELAAQMQYWWADNSVSVTISVKEEEAKELPRILSLYETRLKSVSLLPLRDHGYPQAPYITITKEQYDDMVQKIDVSRASFLGVSAHDVDESGCTSDVCSII